MGELSKLPNVGATLEQKLNLIGIENLGDLQRIGSKEAFRQIREIDRSACINMLCALEGALQGIRWHNLSEGDKAELKAYYSTLG